MSSPPSFVCPATIALMSQKVNTTGRYLCMKIGRFICGIACFVLSSQGLDPLVLSLSRACYLWTVLSFGFSHSRSGFILFIWLDVVVSNKLHFF